MYRLFILFLPFFLFTHSVHSEEVNDTKLLQTFNALPLSFTENQGQVDSDVQFIARGDGGDMFFSAYETTFILQKNKEQTVEKKADISEHAPEESEFFILKRRFLNTNSNLSAEGEDRQQWNTSYFIGNKPTQWLTDVPNYEKISVSNIYDGIDLVYYGDRNVLKYDMVIHSGADPSKVRFYYEGAEGYNVNSDGDLEIYTPTGTVIEKKPYSYQIINGEKKETDVGYKIYDNDLTTISFEVSSYESIYPLIIDPELEYSTFLGVDSIRDMDVDDNGCVYVTGATKSWYFPFLTERYHGKEGYKKHIFAVKFNKNGSGLLYSCLIGGNEDDYGDGIKVDNDGNAFIVACVESANFPVTDQAYLSERPVDVFIEYLAVCKLNASGDSLLYSTYIGESTSNIQSFIDLDNEGNIYVFGGTDGVDFPVTEEAYDKNPNDIFLCKLNSTGTDLVYSTFFGGSNNETPHGIAVDESLNVYITGFNRSPDFPVKYGTYSNYGGFVSKFDQSGSNLVYSTFIDECTPRAITIDYYGNAYITGDANYEFDTTVGSYKTTLTGIEDIFLLKLSPSGNEILYSTFIGGKKIDAFDHEKGFGIVVDKTGNVYITGFTDTQDFPTTPDAYDSSYNGGDYDAFVCKLNPDGSELLYSTYIGGTKIDWGKHIVIDDNGSVFLAGSTDSWDFPVTENAFDKKRKDVFICKLNLDPVHYAAENTPKLFLLKPPYPNPFNSSTTISFTLPAKGFTKLVIYNITGQKVRELVSETMSDGVHNVTWDGRDGNGLSVSSGIYFSRLSSGKRVDYNRMVLMK